MKRARREKKTKEEGDDEDSAVTTRLPSPFPAQPSSSSSSDYSPAGHGQRSHSASRNLRTVSENYQAFVRRVLKQVSSGYAWPLSPELIAFAAHFAASPDEPRFVLYHTCDAGDGWRRGPDRFTRLPPNLFGLRFSSSFKHGAVADPRCVDAQAGGNAAKCCCCVTAKPNLKAIMNETAGMLGAKHEAWTFVEEPPSDVQIIRPGHGVLIDIPPKAGKVVLLFGGACYFVKHLPTKEGRPRESHLPKGYPITYVDLRDLGQGRQGYGVKVSERSSLLTQLIIARPTTIVLLVPSPESHPWAEDDEYKCFSSKPGYLYNIVSEQNVHRIEAVKATDLACIMHDVTEFLERKDTDEDDPVVPETITNSPKRRLDLPPLTPVDDTTFARLGFHDEVRERLRRIGPSLPRLGPPPPPPPALPKFELKIAYAQDEEAESRYEVITPSDQYVEVRISRGEPGLVVSTTSTYFCRVWKSPLSGFVLETVRQLMAPLDDLSDNYFSHTYLTENEPPVLTHFVLTGLAS